MTPAHGIPERPAGRFVVDAEGVIRGMGRDAGGLLGWTGADLGRRSGVVPALAAPVAADPRTGLAVVVVTCRDGGQLEAEVRVMPLPGGALSVLEIQHVRARTPAAGPPAPGFDGETLLPELGLHTDRLDETLRGAQSGGQPVGVLAAGLDGAPGPATVARAAAVLRGALRRRDLLARIGPCEFGIGLSGTSRSQARLVAGRLRAAVERLVPGATLSVGVCGAPADGDGAAALLGCASAALDEARRLGGNRVWFEQRRPRLATDLPVAWAGADAPLGRARDLSASGLFVETAQQLPVDLRVALAVGVPDGPALRLVARVVRCAPGGIAFEIEGCPEGDAARLAALVGAALRDA